MENRTLAVASLIAAIASLAVSTMTLVVVLRQPAFPREFVVKPQETVLPRDMPLFDAAEDEMRRAGFNVPKRK